VSHRLTILGGNFRQFHMGIHPTQESQVQTWDVYLGSPLNVMVFIGLDNSRPHQRIIAWVTFDLSS